MLRFLGTGSAFRVESGNTSAFKVIDEKLLLIDCGGTVFGRILDLGLLEKLQQVDILLTHTHSDHVGSLGELLFYLWFKKGIRGTLHYPDEDRFLQLMSVFGILPKYYSYKADTSLGWNGERIDFVPTCHCEELSSYGILGAEASNKWWYSGDCRDIPGVVLEGFKTGDITTLYQDTASIDSSGELHMKLDQLAEKIPVQERHRVVCMHMDSIESEDQARQMGFAVATAEINSQNEGKR